MTLKLNEMRDRLHPEGADLEIYFEVDEPAPLNVDLEVRAHYDDDNGNRTSKVLKVSLPCTPITPRANSTKPHAFTVKWKANLAADKDLAGRLVQAQYAVKGVISQDWHGIVAIDVTQQAELTRIMLHEFSTQAANSSRFVFDPKPLDIHLNTLTVEQKRLLVNTALENPNGRLVTFVTLYEDGKLRMNADWSDDGATGWGVLSNATFSVFHCRNEARSGGATRKAKSPITLVCHTRYFVLDTNNPETRQWITGTRYKGCTPNEWLRKNNDKPVLFKIAALQPAEKVSNGVIWHAVYEANGRNIMAGNSVHGMINTVGCWMLFRNFNWPVAVRNELDVIYRKVYRRLRPKAEVVAKLAAAQYDVAPGTQKEGFSSSYDKFIKYDRNWAYQWFCHEIVGIKYFSHVDRWEDTKTVNDYNVHGRVMSNSFELSNADPDPAYNGDDEVDYAYHNYSYRKLSIGANLFRTNALGFKTASNFIASMHAHLSTKDLAACSWSDVYFFKEDAVNAEGLKADDIKEKQ